MSSKSNHETPLLDDRSVKESEEKKKKKKDTCQSFERRRGRSGKETIVVSHDQQGSSGAAKKQERNANERLRRLRLHASYLTLGTLLPDHSSSSKKKWCAPSIIDSVITYIPKLQSEVEELTLKKQKLLDLKSLGPSIRAISVLELGRSCDEVVIQISMRKEKGDEFSNFLHVMELQGLSILSASTFEVCQDQSVVVCYNFHVKMNEKLYEGDDYITKLKNSIISSLS